MGTGLFTQPSGMTYTLTIPDIVDHYFVYGHTFQGGSQKIDMPYRDGMDIKHSWMIFSGNDIEIERFNINSPQQVWAFYNLISYNYFIGFVGGFIAVSIMLVTCIGVIQRFFELCILFVASPPLIALMPLDNGKKYEKWRAEFIKRVISAYGPILALNLFFVILPVILRIRLFPSGGLNDLFNSIVSMLFVIVGLVSVKEFSGLISGLLDAQDALKVGEDHKKAVVGMAGRAGVGAIAGTKAALQMRKDFKKPKQDRKNAAREKAKEEGKGRLGQRWAGMTAGGRDEDGNWGLRRQAKSGILDRAQGAKGIVGGLKNTEGGSGRGWKAALKAGGLDADKNEVWGEIAGGKKAKKADQKRIQESTEGAQIDSLVKNVSTKKRNEIVGAVGSSPDAMMGALQKEVEAKVKAGDTSGLQSLVANVNLKALGIDTSGIEALGVPTKSGVGESRESNNMEDVDRNTRDTASAAKDTAAAVRELKTAIDEIAPSVGDAVSKALKNIDFGGNGKGK